MRATSSIRSSSIAMSKRRMGTVTFQPSLPHRLVIQISGAARGTGTNTANAVQSTPAVNMENPLNVVYDFSYDGVMRSVEESLRRLGLGRGPLVDAGDHLEVGEPRRDGRRLGVQRDQHPDLRADYVLANPPFNISDWWHGSLEGDARWEHGDPPRGNANYAWLQHML